MFAIERIYHRCRKFFIFWERGVTFRKFLPKGSFIWGLKIKEKAKYAGNTFNYGEMLTDFSFI
jgi:hypothetical protein